MKFKKTNHRYQELETTAGRQNNDCSIVSISLVTGIDYQTVAETLAKHGKKKNKGTTIVVIKAAMLELGYRMVERNYNQMVSLMNSVSKEASYRVKKLNTRHPKLHNKETNWVKEVPQLWLVPKHILAVIDGVVEDWTHTKGAKVEAIYDVYPIL